MKRRTRDRQVSPIIAQRYRLSMTILMIVMSFGATQIVCADNLTRRAWSGKSTSEQESQLTTTSAIQQRANTRASSDATRRFAPGEVILKFSNPTLVPYESMTAAEFRIRLSKDAPVLVSLLSMTELLEVAPVFSHIQDPEVIRQKFPERAARAPAQAVTPDLRGVWKLRTATLDPAALEAFIDTLRDDTHIAWIHPNHIGQLYYTPGDPRYSEQWYLHNDGSGRGIPDADIDAPEAWEIERGEPEIVIAILDSGIDYTHPDLAENIWTNDADPIGDIPLDGDPDDDGNGFIDDFRGWDFVDNDNDPMDVDLRDDDSHGSHVAGIAAAVTDNIPVPIGVAGVAFQSRIMTVRMAHFGYVVADSAAAIRYATDQGADVINMSYGSEDMAPEEQEAVEYAASFGVVLVAAAGNDGELFPMYPSAYPEVIAVAATDEDDLRADYSNTGSHIEIAAPGTRMLSTDHDFRDGTPSYGINSGTSMASPVVAGVAALILSHALDPAVDDVTAASVRRILQNTADDLYTLGWDPATGFGRVNAFRAVSTIGSKMDDTPYAVAHLTRPFLRQSVANATVYEIYGTAKSTAVFDRYELHVGEGLSPAAWLPIGGSDVPVIDGLLGTWDTRASAPGTWTIRVTVHDGLSVERVATTVVTLDPTLKPGWPVLFNTTNRRPFFLGYLDSPSSTVIDVDSDGDLEIIVASMDGYLYAYHHDGMPVMDAGWPVEISSRPTSEFQSLVSGIPAVGDVDGDGSPEISVNTRNRLHLLRADGSSYSSDWPQRISPVVSSLSDGTSPTLADVDNDGLLDVVFGAERGAGEVGIPSFVHAFHAADGTELAGAWPAAVFAEDVGGPFSATATAVADIDNDGTMNVVGGLAGRLGVGKPSAWALRSDGSFLPPWPIAPGALDEEANIWGGVSVADLDGDGDLELVFAHDDYDAPPTRVHVRHHDGTFVDGWFPTPTMPDVCCTMGAAIGDLDGDDTLEIGIKDMLWHADGTPVAGDWPKSGRVSGSSLIFAEVDGDAVTDVLYAGGPVDALPYGVQGFHMDGSVIPTFPKEPHMRTDAVTATPTVADLEGDGITDIIVTTADGGLFVYQGGAYDACAQRWPKLYGTLANTRYYRPDVACTCDGGSVDDGEECDDGPEGSEACSPACSFTYCGDGITQTPNGRGEGGGGDTGLELCDDGNDDDYDDCKNDCTFNVCGNDRLDPGEACDDGNRDDGDGCSSVCALETAGCGMSALSPVVIPGRLRCDDPCGPGFVCEGSIPGACGGTCIPIPTDDPTTETDQGSL